MPFASSLDEDPPVMPAVDFRYTSPPAEEREGRKGRKNFRLLTPFYYVLPATAEKLFGPSAAEVPDTDIVNKAVETSVEEGTTVSAPQGRGVGVSAQGVRFVHVVPADTDLASVPGLLWGLMASYGKQTLPALMHDQLCEAASTRREDGDKAEGYEDRRRADDLFYLALVETGVDAFRARTFWSGVTFDRYMEFRPFRGLCLLVLIAVSTLSFYDGLIPLVGWAGDQVVRLANWLSGHDRVWSDWTFAGWQQVSYLDWAFGAEAHWWLRLLLPLALILIAVLWGENLWILFVVGTWVGVPVLVALVVMAVVGYWARRVPWRVWKLLSPAPGVPDAGPKPNPIDPRQLPL